MPPGGYTPLFRTRQQEPVSAPPPPPVWPWVTAAIAAVFLLCLVLPASRQFLLDQLGWLPSEKHLVVLPFRVNGGDEIQHAFSEGLREALVTKLKQTETFESNLWVVPTADVGKQPVTNAREARRAFRATLVLNADLNVKSGRVRLEVTLDNAQSGRTLRRRHLQTMSLAQLQDPLEAVVVQVLKLHLSPRDLQLLHAGSSSVPDANTFYVTALGYQQRGRIPRMRPSACSRERSKRIPALLWRTPAWRKDISSSTPPVRIPISSNWLRKAATERCRKTWRWPPFM
jgi:TolB-like protein